MPSDAAAISEPRTAKNARPVLESRRLSSAKSTAAATAEHDVVEGPPVGEVEVRDGVRVAERLDRDVERPPAPANHGCGTGTRRPSRRRSASRRRGRGRARAAPRRRARGRDRGERRPPASRLSGNGMPSSRIDAAPVDERADADEAAWASEIWPTQPVSSTSETATMTNRRRPGSRRRAARTGDRANGQSEQRDEQRVAATRIGADRRRHGASASYALRRRARHEPSPAPRGCRRPMKRSPRRYMTASATTSARAAAAPSWPASVPSRGSGRTPAPGPSEADAAPRRPARRQARRARRSARPRTPGSTCSDSLYGFRLVTAASRMPAERGERAAEQPTPRRPCGRG